MILKDAYRRKIQAQLDEQWANLQILEAKARKALDENKILTRKEAAAIEAQVKAARKEVQRLTAASQGAFKEMEKGVTNALADLMNASKRAARKF